MSKLEAVGLSVVAGLIGFSLSILFLVAVLWFLDGSFGLGVIILILSAPLLLLLISLVRTAVEEWHWPGGF